MKNIFFTILAVLGIQILSAQSESIKKTIDIYYFEELDSENEKFLTNLIQKLFDKKSKFKYEVSLINFYDPSKRTRITSTSSLSYRPKGISNTKFYSESNVQDILDDLSRNVDFSAIVSFNRNYEFNLKELYEADKDKEIKKLFKILRNKKYTSAVILLNNGFKKCRYCPENLSELMHEFLSVGGIEKIIPNIIIPNKDLITLRPEGARYRIEFDLDLDLFHAFEIEITSPSFNVPLLKMVIELSPGDNMKESIIMYNSIDGKKRLYINDDFLGAKCFTLQENVKSDEIDFACDCIYECLYRKEFFIRIRGINSSHMSEELWSPRFKVLFQCSKNL